MADRARQGDMPEGKKEGKVASVFAMVGLAPLGPYRDTREEDEKGEGLQAKAEELQHGLDSVGHSGWQPRTSVKFERRFEFAPVSE